MNEKLGSDIIIEYVVELTDEDACGIKIRQKKADNNDGIPCLSLSLRADCSEFNFYSKEQVKAFVDEMLKVADSTF